MSKTINLEDFKGKKLFFSGIGGCSMSGLAQICKALGYDVSGSDRSASPFTDKLAKEGIPFTLEQKAENVQAADLLIYSAAIKPEHPERAEAKKLGIPSMERSELLGQISAHYKDVICISGCHGKTTITSMLALILLESHIDPTVHVGGMVEFLGGGVTLGKSDMFVTEACEYVESYLTLHPTCVVLNNIDDDHLDYFRDIDHIVESFENFVSLLPKDGWLIGNSDDERVEKILEHSGKNLIRYGLKSHDYSVKNIQTNELGGSDFVVTHQGETLFEASLRVPGDHNVINALAAIVTALHFGVDEKDIVSALKKYTLTKRRFEYYGDKNGVQIYHDYAHHPSEIKACLQGARSVCKGKLYVVFQCNSYTRAKTLFTKTVNCFGDADEVLVPDIYPGRETDDGSVHAKDMVAAIEEGGAKALYIPTFEEISDYLDEHAKPEDMVLTLGSGDVYIQTRKLL